jgi:hypothetical protein
LQSGAPAVIQVRMDRDQLSVQKRLPAARPAAGHPSELIANT